MQTLQRTSKSSDIARNYDQVTTIRLSIWPYLLCIRRADDPVPGVHTPSFAQRHVRQSS